MSRTYDDFTSSLLIWMPCIYFSCLIVMARISNTTLNRSVESGHLCLVPDFSGRAFSFSLLSVMLAVGLSSMAFIIEISYILSVPTWVRIFIMNRY